ncbi:MAG: VCBS repeat-containing protein [Planctomycetota bacterium]
MKRALIKSLASTAVVLAIILGCNTVIDVVDNGGGGTGGGTGGGFATVDSGFSDAPASPGGTGGTDGGGGSTDNSDVELPSEETRSFFTAFQIDPVDEDSAGPKFVVAGDVDQDGLTDLVSAWNQSQPIQLHLQRRDPAGNISFRTITLAGTTPIAVVAGLQLGQINDDGFLDVVVLVKATGVGGFCPTDPPSEISRLEGEIIVLFNPGDAAFIPDGDRWTEMALVNPYVQDRWIHNQFPGRETADFEEMKTKPENGGFTALAVGNLDGNPGDEIVVSLNPGECEELGQKPPTDTVDLWINPGPGLAEDSANWGVPSDIGLSRGAPLTILADAPEVKDIKLGDVDGDGDLDVVAAWSNALSSNVRWARNPLVEQGAGAVISGGSDGDVDRCTGGATDGAPCPNGNADCVGTPDGVCTSGVCVGGANPGATCTDNNGCGGVEDGQCTPTSWRFFADSWEERPVGQIDTAADILAIGDADSDGFKDVAVRSNAGGIIQWFRRPNAQSLPPEFPPNDPLPDRTDFPWTVYTLTEFTDQEPQAIALGDVTGDGQAELLAAVGGGVFWFDATQGTSVYDPWVSNTIIQDSPQSGSSGAATTDSGTTGDAATTTTDGTDVGVTEVDTSTYINALLVVDLDADGKNDVVGTLDRRSGSGLSDDRLVWYRNTRTDEP